MAPLLIATLAFGIVGILVKKATLAGSGTVALVMIQSIAFVHGATLNALLTGKLKPNATTLRYAPVVAFTQLA